MQCFAARSVVLSRQHGQDGRIQPAREEARQRHIADELAPGGIADELMRALDGGLQVVLVLVRFELPVNVIGEVFRSQNGKMSGEQRLDLPENAGFRRARRPEQQQRSQAVLVDDRLDLRVAQHGVDGRTERQAAACRREKQRFYAQPVAAER